MSSLNEFTFPARVYYEDTDAGGVVYHANYLRFMERARTEWLRSLGFEQDQLVQTLGIIFVVGHVDISYRKPARLNDELLVGTTIHKVGKVSIAFHQTITRAGKDQTRELLTTATVKVICVNMATFRSASIPTVIRELLQ